MIEEIVIRMIRVMTHATAIRVNGGVFRRLGPLAESPVREGDQIGIGELVRVASQSRLVLQTDGPRTAECEPGLWGLQAAGDENFDLAHQILSMRQLSRIYPHALPPNPVDENELIDQIRKAPEDFRAHYALHGCVMWQTAAGFRFAVAPEWRPADVAALLERTGAQVTTLTIDVFKLERALLSESPTKP